MKHAFRVFLFVLLLGCIPWSFFPFELLLHFRVQFAVLSGVCVLYFIFKRDPLVLVAGAVSFYYVLELLPFATPQVADWTHDKETLEIFSANVSVTNRQGGEIAQLATIIDPDLVALSEVRPDFLTQLEPLKQRFPYSVSSPDTLPSGPVFFSKHQIMRSGFDAGTNHLEAVLRVRGIDVTVFYVTTPPPLSLSQLARRDHNIDVVSKKVAALSTPVVVLGDFNASPWAPVFERFVIGSEVSDGRIGHGVHPTFPASLSSLGIPIDHCLSGRGLTPVKFRSIGVPGSDHRGIVCEMMWINQSNNAGH